MKGLDLCRRYFHAHGLPMLERLSAGDEVAAGLAGDGSECFGFDDALSRDHDWGPGFCLWIPAGGPPGLADLLRRAYAALPRVFEGHGPRRESAWGGGRTGVFSTAEFYRQFTGLDRPPETLDEWLAIPENALAAATNGEVWHDPPGEFTAWRERLRTGVPEDVWKKRIASRCMTVAQSGQYNLGRCLARNDAFGARYAETKFLADALSMVFLLNRAHAPFYKWLHVAVRGLPVLGREMHARAAGLIAETEPDARVRRVEEICSGLAAELRRQGLSTSTSDFLLDHGPCVRETIRDPGLRARNVWVG